MLSWLGLSGTWFENLLIDGVVAGVGGVLVFVPVLMWLYLALAVLEDSGYMARAAFVMDRAKEVVVGTMAQIYGIEEGADEAAEPTTFLQDVGTIAVSFLHATVDTIKSFPLIVGINLFEGEEEEEPTALMAAAHDDFETTSSGHGALAALAFMVFVLLYTPCMVAVAAHRAEFGTRWMLVSVVGQFVIAWLAAFVVFQGGLLLGIG